MNEEQLQKILNLLEKQRFADWYNKGGRFDDYITGELNAPSKEEILEDLKKMLANC